MIIVTGAAGFIGSCIIAKLNRAGITNIIAVDVLRSNDKWKNLRNLNFHDYLDRDMLFTYLETAHHPESIIHMGASSSTTETDTNYLMENNYRYTLRLARYCIENDVRFIYASSAATYGDGSRGSRDDENKLHELQPMNMYGYSKHLFDLKALREGWLDRIAGLKFFNVYGPNEYHKGEMASVVFKAFNQICGQGYVNLFRSHRPDFEDGEQQRDFVYVMDAVDVVLYFLENKKISGIFNIGSGRSCTFKDLVAAVFKAMDREINIHYIDMPLEIRDRYQYFTQADMGKIIQTGYTKPIHSVEAGVEDYVRNFLMRQISHY